MIKLFFLGTSSGKTSIKRNHTSIYFQFDNTNLLVDCGDGISKSILQNNIPFNSIKNIFISHLHADHFTGIASLITQMKLENRSDELNIYVYKSFVDNIKFLLGSTYMFEEIIGFKINYFPLEFENEVFVGKDFSFITKKNSHIKKKNELINYSNSFFNSSSILLKTNSKNIFYTSDIASTEDLFLFKEDKIDIIISEITHITIDDIYEALKLYVPEKIYLVHYDDNIENNITNWISSQRLNDKIVLAKDGMLIYY
ncbi:MAG: MBL fold metallo-hydrolase [Melioribacteraceae bacterium]|nr:MBL fold metallo-hydrolase [Melioribacteraceae bacterium]